MPALSHPVLAIGVGDLGARVASELAETAAAQPGGDAFRAAELLPRGSDLQRSALKLRDRVRAHLQSLLEAGAIRGGSEGRARLDVVVIATLADVSVEAVVGACRVITDLLADEYGVLFPTAAPPDKRSLWGCLLLAHPAGASAVIETETATALSAIEGWVVNEARHPTFSRIFVLPTQTTSGTLAEEAVEQSLRLFAQGLYLSGVRTDDEIRARLSHRADGRLLATFSVAAAEIPVAKLRRYARERAALDGFTTLERLAEHPSVDAARTDALLLQVDATRYLEAFREGDAAQRLRHHAARLSGARAHLPTRFPVGLLESERSLRGKFRVLFEPAVKSLPGDPTHSPEHLDMLRLLDKAEAGAVQDADRRLQNLLAEELDPTSALQVLPDLEAALARAVHKLDSELSGEVSTLPVVEPPPPPRDEGLEALEQVLRGRPSIPRLIPVLVGLAFVSSVLFALVLMIALEPSASSPAPGGFASSPPPSGAPSSWLSFVPAAVGVPLGACVALAWLTWVLFEARFRLRRQLVRRKAELERLWAKGGGGQEARKAQDLLRVRSRRTAQSLRSLLALAQERLVALRAGIRQGRASARRTLDELRVRLGESPEGDDLSDLVGEDSPLHRALVPPEILAKSIAAARQVRDPDRWAQVLLEKTWPAAGIARDLPCLDANAIALACDAQVPELGAAQLLQGPEAQPIVQAQLLRFLGGSIGALGFGIQPRDEHGDPVVGRHSDQRLLIAPTDLRWALEKESQGATCLWGAANTPWVLVLKTWQGFSAEDLVREVTP